MWSTHTSTHKGVCIRASAHFFFPACQSYNLFSLLAVCRAFPVRMPYNAVWLTSRRQTAAAFSKSISYYTTFPPHFSAAARQRRETTVVCTGIKWELLHKNDKKTNVLLNLQKACASQITGILWSHDDEVNQIKRWVMMQKLNERAFALLL